MFGNNSDDYTASQFVYNKNNKENSNVTQSRRQLFPTIDEDDIDDFSYVAPLNSSHSSCSSSELEELLSQPEDDLLVFSKSTFQDYVIIENIYDNNLKDPDVGTTDNNAVEIKTPQNNKVKHLVNEVTMSPLYLSPVQIVPQSVVFSPKKCKQKSPEPRETTGLNTIANKLIRNYSGDNSPNVEVGKRKLPFSPDTSNKVPKMDLSSKVRTELFPKDAAVLKSIVRNTNAEAVQKTTKVKSPPIYLCSRKSRNHNFSQINAGVRHRIRKPKVKKISNDQILKTAVDILDNSPLNDYFMNISSIGSEFVKKQIQPLAEHTLNNSEVCNIKNTNTNRQKREASSSTPEVPKKFFKSQRSAAVEIDEQLNFKLNRDERNSINDEFNLDVSDFQVPDKENLVPPETIDRIVEYLESGSDEDNEIFPGQLVLKAHASVVMSENSIHLHVPLEKKPNNCSKLINDKSILLSPTSQMCNMTSGLALNSPNRNPQNLLTPHNVLSDFNEVSSAVDMENEKLFPIFCGKQNVLTNSFKTTKPSVRKLKPLPKNQLLLDLGQKRFGATQCTSCEFVYHMGDPNDELLHLNYHNAGAVLRFGGWKDERVVAYVGNGKIIKIVQSDSKPWLKKVRDLLEVVNRDLGYFEMPVSLNNAQIFLFIKKQVIVGCLVAELKTTAYRLLSDNTGIDLCSEIAYPIKCGVNRIWVSEGHRKEGIGTALLNCLRGNFLYGNVLSKEDIALSSPTEAGKDFATKYFGTPNFFIYA
ncbi:hypothetical protein FQA39_LY07024 [Lamprigera yunnana]|nr:hypothetical protein FQA39_LY07024 [Lamprigera yunnana]